jgi:hypothetical protein
VPCQAAVNTLMPTPAPTNTEAPTPVPTETDTPTAMPTDAVAPTATAAETVEPTSTLEPTPALTATDIPTPTDTPRPRPRPEPKAGDPKVRAKDGMTMVYVPAGEFTMGATDADQRAADREKPQHDVYLDAFWIDRTEVTNAQYQECVEAGVCQINDMHRYDPQGMYPWGNGFDGAKLNFCDRNCLFEWRVNLVTRGRARRTCELVVAPLNGAGFLYPVGEGTSPLLMGGRVWTTKGTKEAKGAKGRRRWRRPGVWGVVRGWVGLARTSSGFRGWGGEGVQR